MLFNLPNLGLGKYLGDGDHGLDKVRYLPDKKIHINDTQSFAPVPSEVWDFHIGGYQVLDKYLKSRRAENLLREIENIENIVNALASTILQMNEIDEAYLTAF